MPPTSTSRTFPGQGHDLMLDTGWEEVAASIDEFLVRKVPELSIGLLPRIDQKATRLPSRHGFA